jgi:hypothetical protein
MRSWCSCSSSTIYYARQTKRTVDELREARIAQSLPVLHWQRHPGSAGAGYRASGDRLELNLAILLTNVGPGPARLLEFEATTTNGGEAWQAPEITIPTTLPQGERIELRLEPHSRPAGVARFTRNDRPHPVQGLGEPPHVRDAPARDGALAVGPLRDRCV